MLKECIHSKGLKQKYLAFKLGVSEVTVSNWVKGKAHPTDAHLKRLAEILDMPFEKLEAML